MLIMMRSLEDKGLHVTDLLQRFLAYVINFRLVIEAWRCVHELMKVSKKFG